MRLKLSKPTFK